MHTIGGEHLTLVDPDVVTASLTDERANTIYFGSGSASKTRKLEEEILEGE